MPKNITPRKIINRFIAEYEDLYGKSYNVNFPMIKSVEKIAEFYSLGEIGEAMSYYFSIKTANHSLWEFIDGLDKWLEGSRRNQVALGNLADLMKSTRRRIDNIERGTGVNQQDN